MNADRLITLDGTLHVRAAGPPDDYNNPTTVETSRPVKCWYEQSQRTENTVNTDQQSETHRLFFRRDEDLTGWDALEVDGYRFEVLGPPWPAKNPRTRAVSHVEARGRQVV